MGRQWPGLGERIHQRIRALGFKNAAQFADAKGYRITYIYKWAGGTTPDRENLDKLAKDLEVHPAWLLFGDEIGPLLRRAGKRVLAGLLLATALSVRAAADPLPLGEQVPTARIMSTRWRRWTQWLAARATSATKCHPVAPFLPVRLCLT